MEPWCWCWCWCCKGVEHGMPRPQIMVPVLEKMISYFPPVFYEWFFWKVRCRPCPAFASLSLSLSFGHDTSLTSWCAPAQFPEPTAWYDARLRYARSAAVMSMVGYVVGLGDRCVYDPVDGWSRFRLCVADGWRVALGNGMVREARVLSPPPLSIPGTARTFSLTPPTANACTSTSTASLTKVHDGDHGRSKENGATAAWQHCPEPLQTLRRGWDPVRHGHATLDRFGRMSPTCLVCPQARSLTFPSGCRSA
jgi:hypothetical protein